MSNDNRQTVIEPLLLRADQAARLLNISRSKFYSMHSAGLVPEPIRLVESPRWSIEELTDWIRHGAPSRERWAEMQAQERQR